VYLGVKVDGASGLVTVNISDCFKWVPMQDHDMVMLIMRGSKLKQQNDISWTADAIGVLGHANRGDCLCQYVK
jgi:hypothetical protein